MADGWSVALTVARVSVLLLGVAATFVSFRAYRSVRTRYLRDAAIGFAVITIGVFIEGVLFQFTPLSLVQVHLVESLAIAVGFVALLRSFVR
jgi:hypothetical protein